MADNVMAWLEDDPKTAIIVYFLALVTVALSILNHCHYLMMVIHCCNIGLGNPLLKY